MIIKKEIKDDKAVSVVIGIILAIAIVVAIGVTVYGYLSNMMDEAPKKTPQVNFFADDATNILTITSFNMNLNWSDINMSATDGVSYLYNYGLTGDVTTGDSIEFDNNGIVSGDLIIRFRYNPTNTLIGTYKLNSVIK
jgi:FlaG/FlaF family flagellin (archaellin)